MKVIRILKFEGTKEQLDVQIGHSLPDGVKVVKPGLTITTVTLGELPDKFDLLLSEKDSKIEEESPKKEEQNGHLS